MTGACTNRYTSKDMRGESVSPPWNTAISPMRLEQDMVYLVCVYLFEACSRLWSALWYLTRIVDYDVAFSAWEVLERFALNFLFYIRYFLQWQFPLAAMLDLHLWAQDGSFGYMQTVWYFVKSTRSMICAPANEARLNEMTTPMVCRWQRYWPL